MSTRQSWMTVNDMATFLRTSYTYAHTLARRNGLLKAEDKAGRTFMISRESFAAFLDKRIEKTRKKLDLYESARKLAVQGKSSFSPSKAA